MRSSFAPLALAALVAANPVPQGVTSAISPPTSAPAGCSPDYPGTFEISVVNVTSASSKRSFQKRQGALVLTLQGGILKDAQGRIGYIADNRQFQFDGPPQTGAIYTAGWSVCQNGTLAIGGDAIFDQCLSGTFYNLYDEATSAQCSPIYIQVIGGAAPSGGVATEQPDGQPTASPVAQISDGQIQQISDGQIQNPTGSPVTQIGDGQPQAPVTTAAPVGEISDGQPQAYTSAAAPVSQIGDGQVQAPTTTPVAPVSQISDGQIQAPTSAPVVSQISDGQIQAPTSAPVAPVTQISDGQIQAPTSTPAAAPVSQIGDGQVQAGNATMTAMPSATPQPYTGAASVPTFRNELFGLAAGVLALAMF